VSDVVPQTQVAWPVVCIGRLGRFFKGSGLSKKELVPSGVPCIRYGELYTKHRFIVRQFYSYIPDELAARSVLLAKGDVLFAASGETLDEIGKSVAYLLDERACVGGDIIVLRPGPNVDSHFLGYALESTPAVAQKSQMGHGITVMHIYSSALKYLRLHVPPLTAQKAIAGFLDRKTAAIDALIDKKQKLLDLLAEKRAALINQAVTRGLAPNVPMKDSGIPWIGEIPAHWEIRKVWTQLRPVKVQGHPHLQMLSVYREHGVVPKDSRDDNHNRDGKDLAVYQVVQPGQLVMNKMKAWQGSIAASEHQGLVSPDYMVLDRIGQTSPRYLHFLLRSARYIAEYKRLAYGVRPSQWRLMFNEFRDVPLVLPPLAEQDHLSEAVGAITATARRAQAGIDLQLERLQEYRQALITAAVTGQLDIGDEANP